MVLWRWQDPVKPTLLLLGAELSALGLTTAYSFVKMNSNACFTWVCVFTYFGIGVWIAHFLKPVIRKMPLEARGCWFLSWVIATIACVSIGIYFSDWLHICLPRRPSHNLHALWHHFCKYPLYLPLWGLLYFLQMKLVKTIRNSMKEQP
ncbi:MAG: hypothetical protein K6F50_06210 [Kiritimatiellae bacterium]|nr:hypothetical protein [Kiritimatiellia bacterium]